jgi:Restriction endonuclease fold toxin 5
MTSPRVARRRVRPIRYAAGGSRAPTGGHTSGRVTGRWVQSFNAGRGMSDGAAAYQKQITCRSPTMEFYMTDGSCHAHFDGYHRGVLLEAKHYLGSIQSMPLKRVRFLLGQARRQSRLAGRAGLPLEWHVASPEAAHDLGLLFGNNNVTGIRVHYTRPGRSRC